MPRARSNRTSIKPSADGRTRTVRINCRLARLASLILAATIVWVGFESSAGEGAGVASQQRREARGWLELDADQRGFRERVEPLAPADTRTLEQLEHRQRLDLRTLQQEQRREVRADERRARSLGKPPPARAMPELRRDMSDTRERVERRIQQETFRGGGG
jgi:hypothetical protein